MYKSIKLWFCLISLISISSLNQANALDCPDTEVIYARGSGQQIGAGMENEIKKQTSEKLNALNITNDFKSLSKQMLPGLHYDYPAKSIWGWDDEKLQFGTLDGAEALVSGQEFGTYKYSVQDGIETFYEYIERSNCPASNLVLIGYSQGADVIGKVMSDDRYASIMQRVKYIGLLGDPKLDIKSTPESIFTDPYWYRGTAVPLIQGGVLMSKTPYDSNIPNLNNKFGSWCLKDDIICAMLGTAAGHGKYLSNGDINNMALEIANAINNPTGVVDKNLRTPDYCTTNKKQDIVMLVDTSPFMRRNQALFTDTTLYNYNPRQAKTAGQQIVDAGCGDTRVAVVGYAGPGEDPRLLLDFTSKASDYDALMKSLYQPSDTGTYGRTQLREGAIMASQVNWREDAMKTVFTLTNVTGSGPTSTWRGWGENYPKYLSDVKTQELIEKFRAKNIVMLGMQVPSDYTGYTLAPNEDANSTYDANGYLLKSIINATGGYAWIRQYNYYDPYTFKKTLLDITLNDSFKMRSSIDANVPSFRGEVGKQLTLDLQDNLHYLAAAKLRGDGVSFTWYADCSDNAISRLYDIRQKVLFTPTKAGKCKGAVHISLQRNTPNGCYFGCPEPFPPYAFRSIPFDIDVKPAGYVAKVPGPVTNIDKTIYDDSVVYTWDEPVYYGSEPLVYLVKDQDGSIVAATRTRKLTITDTNKTDPTVSITPLGEDGRAEPAASDDDFVDTHDMRTPDQTSEPVSDPTNTPVVHNNPTIPPNPSHSPTHAVAAALSPHPITLGTPTLPTTTSTFYSDPTMDGDSYGTNVLGEAVTPAKANAKHTYTHAATVTAKPDSTFSLLAVPLSVALTLGVLVAAAVYIRIR